MSSINCRRKAASGIRSPKPEFTNAVGRRFLNRVKSGTLSPRWREGEIVEFEIVDPHGPLAAGEDYYIETAVGCTFLRLAQINNAAITLTTIDGDRRWSIPRREIKRAAIALYVVSRNNDAGMPVYIPDSEIAERHEKMNAVNNSIRAGIPSTKSAFETLH